MNWHLDNTAETSAGRVAWGRAGSGPALVLAHGWPWSSWAWHAVIPELSREFSVFWYDMPGFGRSLGDPGKATGLDVQGKIFAEMLAIWDLSAPAIWCHDFGGAVSLRARLLHGAGAGAHVLMNVVAMRPWGSAFFDHVGRHIEAFTGLPPHIHAAVVDAYIRGALARPLPDETITTLATPWLSDAGQRAFYSQFAQADERFTAEIEPQFGDLAPGTHVLWGAEDPWIPLARGQALADAIGCGIDVMDDLGHLPQLENPVRALGCAALRLKKGALERV